MTNHPASGNGPAMPVKTLDDLTHMAVMLAGFCDGLDAIHDAATAEDQGPAMYPATRRARNAMTPYILTLMGKAQELSEELERAALAAKREGRA